MPSLSTKTKDSVAQVAIKVLGYTGNAGDNATNVVLSDTAGKGAKLLVDIVAGYTSNIRVLDGGRGYTAILTDFNRSTSPLNPALQVMIGNEAFKNPTSSENIFISNPGTGFTAGQQFEFSNTTGAVVTKLTVFISQVGNAGEMEKVSPILSQNYLLSDLQEKEFTGGTNGAIYIVKQTVAVTTEQAGNAVKFEVGDLITKNPAGPDKAVVLAVSADAVNNTITKMGIVAGTFAPVAPATTTAISVGAINKNITAYGNEDSNFKSVSGLCLDPIYDFDTYANGAITESQKIKIDTSNVYLQVDIVYYMDGTTETMREKMMTPEGLSHTYTSFINTTSSFVNDNAVASYGQTDTTSENRLIGLSNSTVRNIMWYVYNSGTQNNDKFPYKGFSKSRLPLLNKYHARSSLSMGGTNYNMNINSVPYYSTQVDDDMRAYTELSKCKGQFYVNKAQYMGWTACRQLDNPTAALSDAAPSKQPGFCDLDDATLATKQYEINERKAGISNQSYEGVNQAWLRGMAHYMGVNFQLSDVNVMGNGLQVGSTPVDMNLDFVNTYNPYYSGSGTLTLFAEVERRLAFQNGVVILQTASY